MAVKLLFFVRSSPGLEIGYRSITDRSISDSSHEMESPMLSKYNQAKVSRKALNSLETRFSSIGIETNSGKLLDKVEGVCVYLLPFHITW